VDVVQRQLAAAYPTSPVLISDATVTKGVNAFPPTTESQTDHSMLHILDCLMLVPANDDEGGTKTRAFVTRESKRERRRSALKNDLGRSWRANGRESQVLYVASWVGYDLVRNGLRRQRIPPLYKVIVGEPIMRTMMQNAREKTEWPMRAMSELCSSERPDFPLPGPRSQKVSACTEGATSPRFFDKKTEMGRKGKLARGRTKGSPSWKAGCQGARNASKKT
jgi:hypothetical protein